MKKKNFFYFFIIIIINSAIDNLMIDLSNHARGKSTTFLQPAVQKTHRDDNQTNNTAFRSAVLNDNQSEKFITATQLYDLEDQREEEVELESENFKTILNPIPLHVNNNTENILDGEKLTKNEVIRLEKFTTYQILYYVFSISNNVYK